MVRQLLLVIALLLPGAALAVDSEALRRYVEELAVGGAPQPVFNPAQVVAWYGANQNRFLWYGEGPLAAMRDELLAEILASAGHGFELSRYHYQALEGQALPQEVLEVLFTDALFSQISHRASGVVAGQEQDWFIARPAVDAPAMLSLLLAERGDVSQLLRSLWPQHAEYRALVDKRAELVAGEDLFTQPVAPGPLLRRGSSGPRVQQLYLRLFGPGEHPEDFDQPLAEAVTAMQRAAGLEADGIVGAATLQVLNANRFSWIDRIDANLERWRWLPRELPATYIRVNIADFRLRAIAGGHPEVGMDVIVGRPYRQTPIFTQTLKYLVFYPFWTVPTSIAVKDKLPLLRTDPGPLAKAGYEVQLPGAVDYVTVAAVNWTAVKPGGFQLRQRPGEKNALGRVKFMFPNPHDVYLHDTPDKGLFGKTERIFSSGCIRVADPMGLVEWVLRRDNNPALGKAAQLFASGPTTTVYLARPIPVYLVYFTAFFQQSGVVFRRDVYDRDQRIITELRAAGASI